jgi:S-adenosylmethionine-diacylglycerol 3-amino-3-carboxypropyl transferase
MTNPRANDATTEVAGRADFSGIRYAQVWEDADILRAGLATRPGDACLSIASAGDNAIALLLDDPAEVLAVDLSAAQLACVALRVAAYRVLDHDELLELMGSRPSDRRAELYARCAGKGGLDAEARSFWDAHPALIAAGIGSAGKFERYFAAFRRWCLPLIAGRATIDALVEPRSPVERERFYRERWDSWRWRLLFRVFFSRAAMGRLGRDPEFFRYVEGSVAERIMARARHALVELDPSENPYLAWILFGRHRAALPCALRSEHFETIRARIDRLRWARMPFEEALREPRRFDRFNASDIFEYMSREATDTLLARVAHAGRPQGRIAYWNMLVPRARPDALADRLASHDEEARRLFLRDKAFFYARFVIEEILR